MLTIPISQDNKVPMYEQIYDYIKREILSGHLKAGEKLPSTRQLSGHLCVSRNTIDMAYDQLISEGYIDSYPKRGYYVNDIHWNMEAPLHRFLPTEQSANGVNSIKQPTKAKYSGNLTAANRYTYDFSPFAIDLEHFPYHTWQKLLKTSLKERQDLFLLGPNQGDLSFRKALQTYLRRSRGVLCEPEQIIIGAGADYLLQLLCQIFEKDSIIALENPTYMRAYRIFQGFSYKTVPIELDDSGISVSELVTKRAKIAYVTPSHQYPLGIIMPIKRRKELLSWANESTDRYIIEDDHDSEFRFKGKPIPSLQSIDPLGRVIYMGTFSRSIAPAIRIAYMVLPTALLQKYQQLLPHYSSTVSRIDQAIMTEFLTEGYFERHLNRMRTLYKTKHDVMLSALRQFGKHITLLGEQAGLHLAVRFHVSIDESTILSLAFNEGIRLYPLSKHLIGPMNESHPCFLMGFGSLNEEQIQEGMEKLYLILKPYFL